MRQPCARLPSFSFDPNDIARTGYKLGQSIAGIMAGMVGKPMEYGPDPAHRSD